MRPVFGLILLGARGVWRLMPRRTKTPKPMPAWRAPRAFDDRSSRMRWTQRALGGAGVALLLWGAFVLFSSVSFTVPHYLGLVIWLGGAIVLHDVVLVPLVILLRAGLHRVGSELPRGGIGLIQAGFVVGAVLTLITAPEIYAQSLGSRNATVLPSEYGPRLVATWIVIALLVVLGNLALHAYSRVQGRQTRSRRRASSRTN